MKSTFKKILYTLVVFILLFISNILVVKPLFAKDEIEFIPASKVETTLLEKKVIAQNNLYSKVTIDDGKADYKSQEWYQVNLRSDAIVKFQYSVKKNNISKLNIKINDVVIENDEDFFEYDKFKINFYFYGDKLVIEHERHYDHIPYVKIIDLETGLMRNIPTQEDFYINDVIIDEYGVTAVLSRLTSNINYYIRNNQTFLTFRVKDTDASLNVCNRATWPDDLMNLDYVSFDINYPFIDNSINFDKPDIVNFKNLNEFMKEYKGEFNDICQNNN